MIAIAVVAMVCIPTVTSAAGAKVLADLDALGSDAWIVTPVQVPGGPTARTPPGAIERLGEIPGVKSVIRVLGSNLTAAPNSLTAGQGSLPVLGLAATTGASAVEPTAGTFRPVPGLPIGAMGSDALYAPAEISMPAIFYAGREPITVTGTIQGDPLAPQLDTALIVPDDWLIAHNYATSEQLIVRGSGLSPSALEAAADPYGTITIRVDQPASLIAARDASTSTLSGLSAVASAVAFGVAVLGITILLTSSVRQRSPELAVRRVHGASASSVIRLIMGEAIVLGLSGAALGLLVSALGIFVLRTVNNWPNTTSPLLMVAAVVASLLCTLLASIPPALLAIRIQPARAFAIE